MLFATIIAVVIAPIPKTNMAASTIHSSPLSQAIIILIACHQSHLPTMIDATTIILVFWLDCYQPSPTIKRLATRPNTTLSSLPLPFTTHHCNVHSTTWWVLKLSLPIGEKNHGKDVHLLGGGWGGRMMPNRWNVSLNIFFEFQSEDCRAEGTYIRRFCMIKVLNNVLSKSQWKLKVRGKKSK